MGVYLSEHPFTPYASKITEENITLCGQIEPDMVGQTVQVAGMVASVIHLLTKSQKPFVKAILEDLDGSIEVMVWSDVYTETIDLWEEGTIVLVEGRVSTREDSVQISCKKASRYQPEQAALKKPNTLETKPPIVSNGKTTYNGKSVPGSKPVAIENPVPAEITPPQRYRLIISIKGTIDEQDDLNRLRKVIYKVKEYPGRDEVSLRIINNGKIVKLKLPNIYTGYSPELYNQVIDLVGESGLLVESLPDEA
jgi:DNA polymerase-3 subunit alpha